MAGQRKLRLGMIGGGPGAFIGAVHRLAAEMDREFELVAGAFSSDPQRSRETGAELGLSEDRVYADWSQLLQQESALPADQRIHAVAIVTPNHLHHEPAIAALNAGFNVICDKPMTISSEFAQLIKQAVDESGKVFALTHNYTGYPMVREARELIAGGEIGKVRKVFAEYFQGWLGDPLEESGQKQAAWRTDPACSGPGGSLGDIGTHAFNLLEHVCADEIKCLYGFTTSFVAGRRVDDDAMTLLKMKSGANGSICCSQVCTGSENGLRLRVFGTEGGLEWAQENPNDLIVWYKNGARETRRTANPWLSESAQSLGRVPAGHPEGYLEGFANIYRAFARAINGDVDIDNSYPTVEDGIRGVRFIESVLESNASGEWVEVDPPS